MRFEDFKNKIIYRPIVFSRDLELFLSKSKKQLVHNQFKRWKDKGLLIKLKNGVYLLNERERKISPSMTYIANQLYVPSYISLEYALSFYNLIPEGVYDITSVTTKKTIKFINKVGIFNYQHIKKEGFEGYKSITDVVLLNFLIAEPEKAVIDFLYLNLNRFKSELTENEALNIFEQSYRFQNVESLNIKKLNKFSKLFNSNKLSKIVNYFCKLVEIER